MTEGQTTQTPGRKGQVLQTGDCHKYRETGTLKQLQSSAAGQTDGETGTWTVPITKPAVNQAASRVTLRPFV